MDQGLPGESRSLPDFEYLGHVCLAGDFSSGWAPAIAPLRR
jgi:hypothetical protein